MQGHVSARTFGWAAVATAGLVIIKVGLGIWGGSMALVSDGIHSLTDLVAFGAGAVAAHWSHRPADPTMTYGYPRINVLMGVLLTAVLLAVALFIAVAAVSAMGNSGDSRPWTMLVGGGAGLAVNLVLGHAFGGHDGDLNRRSARLHTLTDAGGSVAVLVAAGLIALWGAQWANAAAALLIAALIGAGAVGILRDGLVTLSEGVPRDIDLASILESMTHVGGVVGVHHLHVWGLSPDERLLTAHVCISSQTSLDAGQHIIREIDELVALRFQVGHTTLQLETSDNCSAPGHEPLTGPQAVREGSESPR